MGHLGINHTNVVPSACVEYHLYELIPNYSDRVEVPLNVFVQGSMLNKPYDGHLDWF